MTAAMRRIEKTERKIGMTLALLVRSSVIMVTALRRRANVIVELSFRCICILRYSYEESVHSKGLEVSCQMVSQALQVYDVS